MNWHGAHLNSSQEDHLRPAGRALEKRTEGKHPKLEETEPTTSKRRGVFPVRGPAEPWKHPYEKLASQKVGRPSEPEATSQHGGQVRRFPLLATSPALLPTLILNASHRPGRRQGRRREGPRPTFPLGPPRKGQEATTSNDDCTGPAVFTPEPRQGSGAGRVPNTFYYLRRRQEVSRLPE